MKRAAFRQHGDTMVEAWDWIIAQIKLGRPIRHAVAMAGFSASEFYRICEADEESKLEADQARREGEDKLISGLYDAAREDPKFGLMLLERRRPQEWGKTDRVEHSGGVTLKQPTRAEALAELREALAANPKLLDGGEK